MEEEMVEVWRIFYVVAMSVVYGMTAFSFLVLILLIVVPFLEKK